MAVYEFEEYQSEKEKQKIAQTRKPTITNALVPLQYRNCLLKALDNEGPGLHLSTITTERKEI